jgi:hypothetical protein
MKHSTFNIQHRTSNLGHTTRSHFVERWMSTLRSTVTEDGLNVEC